MKAAKKIWTKQCKLKKKCALKMTVAKKIGAKQLKKMHLIKMTGAKKIWTKQCTIKKIRIKMTVAKKNRNKSVAKNGNL